MAAAVIFGLHDNIRGTVGYNNLVTYNSTVSSHDPKILASLLMWQHVQLDTSGCLNEPQDKKSINRYCKLPYLPGVVDLTAVERASYFHLGKIAWALAVGWVILACELDVAGTVGYGSLSIDKLFFKLP